MGCIVQISPLCARNYSSSCWVGCQQTALNSLSSLRIASAEENEISLLRSYCLPGAATSSYVGRVGYKCLVRFPCFGVSQKVPPQLTMAKTSVETGLPSTSSSTWPCPLSFHSLLGYGVPESIPRYNSCFHTPIPACYFEGYLAASDNCSQCYFLVPDTLRGILCTYS